jgi:hypothetical protein
MMIKTHRRMILFTVNLRCPYVLSPYSIAEVQEEEALSAGLVFAAE